MNRIDPRKQFSKRLARWTAVFWFLYMSWLSVILIVTPAAAMYSVYMAIISTAVMLFMTVAYTRNSISEKMMLAFLDKTKLELSLKGSTASKLDNKNKNEDEDEDIIDDEPEGGEG